MDKAKNIIYTEKDYNNLLTAIMMTGYSARYICKNRKDKKIKSIIKAYNLPSYSLIVSHANEDKKFRKALDVYQEKFVSFSLQAEGRFLGKRFHNAVKKLRKNDPKEIAYELGVSVYTVERAFKKLGIKVKK